MNIYTNTPYVYRIHWSKTGMNYVGVRYAKDCHPDDLFVTYFTSSKYVADYIKEHGLPDIIEIRKKFTGEDRRQKAIIHEERVLKRLNVIGRQDYLNKHDGSAVDPSKCAWSKGKTKETNPSLAKMATTLSGRTKETHSYLAEVGKKNSAQTSANNPKKAAGRVECAKKMTGRTKDTHQYLVEAANKRSATMKGNSYGGSKGGTWRIVDINGVEQIIVNLTKWCIANNFRKGTVIEYIKRKGSYKEYKITRLD